MLKMIHNKRLNTKYLGALLFLPLSPLLTKNRYCSGSYLYQICIMSFVLKNFKNEG